MRERTHSRLKRLRDWGAAAAPVVQKGLGYGLAAAAGVAAVHRALQGGGGGDGPRHATAEASPDFVYHGIRYGDALESYGRESGGGGGGGSNWQVVDGRWRRVA